MHQRGTVAEEQRHSGRGTVAPRVEWQPERRKIRVAKREYQCKSSRGGRKIAAKGQRQQKDTSRKRVARPQLLAITISVINIAYFCYQWQRGAAKRHQQKEGSSRGLTRAPATITCISPDQTQIQPMNWRNGASMVSAIMWTVCVKKTTGPVTPTITNACSATHKSHRQSPMHAVPRTVREKTCTVA